MNSQQNYIRQLEETIRKFLEPIEDIPFPLVVKALTGCKVLPFDPSLAQNREVLKSLSIAAMAAGQKAFSEGITAKRPNEVGNKIESFVRDALNEIGLRAVIPVTRKGRKQSTGYPDLMIFVGDETIIYMDCKTYSPDSREQTLRTFYFSPSKDPKIIHDASHLLMSFEIRRELQRGENVWVPISWQLYTLERLSVQIKHEFNANNRQLYMDEALLAAGEITATR